MAQRDLTSNQRLCLIAAIAFVSKFQPELTGHERTDVITELTTNGFVSVDFHFPKWPLIFNHIGLRLSLY